MKLAGLIFVVLGVLFSLLMLFTLLGNRDLDTPGPSLLGGAPAWRFTSGLFCLLAAVLLTAGWTALRRLPGLSWLALLVFLILAVPYLLIPALVSNATVLALLALVLVVAIPAGVVAIAETIGRARRTHLGLRSASVAA